VIVTFSIVVCVGCFVGGFFAVKGARDGKVRQACLERNGGERCKVDMGFARCVGENGAGFCEGVLKE